jgi:hypothetical protein
MFGAVNLKSSLSLLFSLIAFQKLNTFGGTYVTSEKYGKFIFLPIPNSSQNPEIEHLISQQR